MALLLTAPAFASTGDDLSAISHYVRARAADAEGAVNVAAAGYAAALVAQPGDPIIAIRAFRQAILAGDRTLAVSAARTLDRAGALPDDGLLLLYSDALIERDWTAAGALIDRIEKEGSFSFLVPVMRAWTTFGARQGDPLAFVSGEPRSALGSAYAAEHRALLLLASRRADEGLTAAQALGGTGATRTIDTRLAAAAQLAALRRRDDALTLLGGEVSLLRAARAMVERRRKLPGAVDSAAEGVAALFLGLAADLNRDGATPTSMTLSRLALFLDPESDRAKLATAQMLGATGHDAAALALLGQIGAKSLYAPAAADGRVVLLVRQGEQERALAGAIEAAARSGAGLSDLLRVGDLYARLDRHGEAAAAYDRAIAYAEANPGAAAQPWTLWLLKGGAHEQAGDWDLAKPALERAAALAPEQPTVLNYLGYAQLERRENLDEAVALIARASALQPDSPAITDSLGWAHYVRGEIDKAIPALERAVEGEPGDPTINEHLGDAYWAAGRKIDARYAWRAAAVYAEDDAAARLRTKLETGLTPEVAAP